MASCSPALQQSSYPWPLVPPWIRVLHVDDDHEHLRVVEEVLSAFRYLVTTCDSTPLALKKLEAGNGGFELVMTEVRMPVMNGFQLLNKIKQKWPHIPVMMLSIERSPEIIEGALQRGASFYLTKPASTEELRSIWQRCNWAQKSPQVWEIVGVEGDTTHEQEEETQKQAGEADGGEQQKRKRKRKKKKSAAQIREFRPRFQWKTSLHGQFLSAIERLGKKRAVPSAILPLINIPGVTRHNIASHLQKYRQFMRKLLGGEIKTGPFRHNSAQLPLPHVSSSSTSATLLPRSPLFSMAASSSQPPPISMDIQSSEQQPMITTDGFPGSSQHPHSPFMAVPLPLQTLVAGGYLTTTAAQGFSSNLDLHQPHESHHALLDQLAATSGFPTVSPSTRFAGFQLTSTGLSFGVSLSGAPCSFDKGESLQMNDGGGDGGGGLLTNHLSSDFADSFLIEQNDRILDTGGDQDAAANKGESFCFDPVGESWMIDEEEMTKLQQLLESEDGLDFLYD